MLKIKNGGLDQYGAKPFEQQRYGTAGVERVKARTLQADNDVGMLSGVGGSHELQPTSSGVVD